MKNLGRKISAGKRKKKRKAEGMSEIETLQASS